MIALTSLQQLLGGWLVKEILGTPLRFTHRANTPSLHQILTPVNKINGIQYVKTNDDDDDNNDILHFEMGIHRDGTQMGIGTAQEYQQLDWRGGQAGRSGGGRGGYGGVVLS